VDEPTVSISLCILLFRCIVAPAKADRIDRSDQGEFRGLLGGSPRLVSDRPIERALGAVHAATSSRNDVQVLPPQGERVNSKSEFKERRNGNAQARREREKGK